MKQTKPAKHKSPGFGMRLVLPIALTVMVLGLGTVSIGMLFNIGRDFTVMILLIAAASMAVLAALSYAFAILGKKHKWANTACIVIGAISCLIFGPVLGIFPILGGVKGSNALKQANGAAESQTPDAVSPAETVSAPKTAGAPQVGAKTLEDYPVDYENKPLVSRVLDENNTENLVLQNETDFTAEFRQLYVQIYDNKLYLVTETVDIAEEDGGGIVIFRVDYEHDKLIIEHDETICNAVLNAYQAAASGESPETKTVKRSEFTLDLYDASVDEKTWKAFKKTASQEELAVIAIGAKYRIAHSRILNIFYAIGIILSIAIFWPTGGWSLIGYPVFAFLATKAIRYQDTYSQAYRELSAEYKAFVNNYYNSSIWLKIADGLIQFATFWLTLPYQAIMLFIGTFAPNFVIAKNGILVSIPNGYDVGDLGAIGAYYKSFNLIDEAQATSREGWEEFTYTGDNGCQQTVYVDRNGNARNSDGSIVGTVSGEGSNRTFTPN